MHTLIQAFHHRWCYYLMKRIPLCCTQISFAYYFINFALAKSSYGWAKENVPICHQKWAGATSKFVLSVYMRIFVCLLQSVCLYPLVSTRQHVIHVGYFILVRISYAKQFHKKRKSICSNYYILIVSIVATYRSRQFHCDRRNDQLILLSSYYRLTVINTTCVMRSLLHGC